MRYTSEISVSLGNLHSSQLEHPKSYKSLPSVSLWSNVYCLDTFRGIDNNMPGVTAGIVVSISQSYYVFRRLVLGGVFSVSMSCTSLLNINATQ